MNQMNLLGRITYEEGFLSFALGLIFHILLIYYLSVSTGFNKLYFFYYFYFNNNTFTLYHHLFLKWCKYTAINNDNKLIILHLILAYSLYINLHKFHHHPLDKHDRRFLRYHLGHDVYQTKQKKNACREQK